MLRRRMGNYRGIIALTRCARLVSASSVRPRRASLCLESRLQRQIVKAISEMDAERSFSSSGTSLSSVSPVHLSDGSPYRFQAKEQLPSSCLDIRSDYSFDVVVPTIATERTDSFYLRRNGW